MRKPKYKYKKISIDLYETTVHCFISNDWRAVEKRSDMPENYLEDKVCDAIVTVSSEGTITVVFKSTVTFGTIAHECLHLSNKILEDVGIYLRLANEEPHAYMIGYLFEQIQKLFEEYFEIGKTVKKKKKWM